MYVLAHDWQTCFEALTVLLRPRPNLELFMGRTKLRELKKNYDVEKVSTATSHTSFQCPGAKRLTQKYSGIAAKTCNLAIPVSAFRIAT